ncbi:hypothetical protein [Oryza sativa Japonica Group]|uniref:Uncharacterized protein P0710A02.18 n=1 Tax=Oryza sativa subsp. japonica TaxID=39947 RepID=Q5ZD23_ORYSJ|nr:hypothetical protein [Oryza sativa Japonica Group]
MDSDTEVEAFSRICRLQDVDEGRAEGPYFTRSSYECNCDCPYCCEPGSKVTLMNCAFLPATEANELTKLGSFYETVP